MDMSGLHDSPRAWLERPGWQYERVRRQGESNAHGKECKERTWHPFHLGPQGLETVGPWLHARSLRRPPLGHNIMCGSTHYWGSPCAEPAPWQQPVEGAQQLPTSSWWEGTGLPRLQRRKSAGMGCVFTQT